MQYIKVKVLKNSIPTGAEYTYSSEDSIKLGDTVNLPHFRPTESTNYPKGIVTDVGIDGETILFPLDKMKSIIGKVVIEDEPRTSK